MYKNINLILKIGAAIACMTVFFSPSVASALDGYPIARTAKCTQFQEGMWFTRNTIWNTSWTYCKPGYGPHVLSSMTIDELSSRNVLMIAPLHIDVSKSYDTRPGGFSLFMVSRPCTRKGRSYFRTRGELREWGNGSHSNSGWRYGRRGSVTCR